MPGIVVVSAFYLLIYQVHTTVAKNKQTDENYSKNNGTSTLLHDVKFKQLILDWWEKNNVPNPNKCNYKIRSSYNNTYIRRKSSPEIKSFPCQANTTSPHYVFKGFVNNGHLDGKGRLLFMSNQDWKKLPKQKRKNMEENHVCFSTTHMVNNQRVREIVGTFKNGALYGMARITFTDYSFSIGRYKNGKAHGYQRSFNQNGSLLDAGLYENGWKIGYHWKSLSYHLLYQDKSMVVDVIKPILLFPFLKDGTLGDPIAGDYFPHSGALENIHKITITNITPTNSSYCIPDIVYKLQDKENYTYSIHSMSKFPLYAYKNHTLLCETIPKNSNDTAPEKLRKWFRSIDKTLMPKTVHNYGVNVSRAHEILWRLRPELEEPDRNKSPKLISDIVLNPKTKNITARILGSPAVEIRFAAWDVMLDSNNQLNGINDIYVVNKYRHLIPKDNTLGWSPVRIVGRFSHGDLNGYTLVETNVSTYAWVTVNTGILHGPSILYGISHILEPVSKFNYERIFCMSTVTYRFCKKFILLRVDIFVFYE